MSDETILFPDRGVKLSTGETITVRELSWHEALAFLRLLAEKLGTVGQAADLSLTAFGDLVVSAADLSQWLAEKAAGLTADKFGALPARDALAVLDAALAVNLNEELLGRAKKIGARFTGLGGSAASGNPQSKLPESGA